MDAINIYPSITLATIKKDVIFFTKGITTKTKKIANQCLDLIRFGMRFTLISFDREYYKFHGSEKREQGLAIGG